MNSETNYIPYTNPNIFQSLHYISYLTNALFANFQIVQNFKDYTQVFR